MQELKTQWIKKAARDLGFDLVGVALADDPNLTEAIRNYSAWVGSGHAAGMEYLARHSATKADPQKFLNGARSVVCVGLLYGETRSGDDENKALVSQYTRGRDYHELIEEKLKVLAESVCKEFGDFSYRIFVDKEPVLDRFWAWRAGLGWLGKNTVLINRKQGSFLFVGGFMTDLDLVPDAPHPEHCGKCRKCIEACPTGAILEPSAALPRHAIDSEKCIAYHTIENKGAVPEAVMARTGRWIAGCDICQDVCPWNDPVTASSAFEGVNPAFGASLTELAQWSRGEFKTKLDGVAMVRMKYSGFLRNLTIAVANSGLKLEEKVATLERLEKSMSSLDAGDGKDGALKTLAWAKGALS